MPITYAQIFFFLALVLFILGAIPGLPGPLTNAGLACTAAGLLAAGGG